MKIKNLSALLLISAATLPALQAQEAIPATGGEGSGSGGTTSYTVGQVVYTTTAGTNGNTIAEGVQQPYEISVVTGVPEAEGITLSALIYPNPATSYLVVKIENYETTNLEFQVFDMNGKLLESKKADGKETTIETAHLVAAKYFVKVIDNNKEIKVFKFIKTN